MAPNTITGTGVVQGIAYAPAAWLQERPLPPEGGRIVPEEERAQESARFAAAALVVADRFATRAAAASGATAEVLAATASLAKDRGLLRAAQHLIDAGSPAEVAAAGAIQQFADMFEKVGGVMAERISDLNDIRDRVIAELLGQPEPGIPTPDEPIVLLADDLAPADAADLDPQLIRALATRQGGPTSHTAIIARQLGIPCVMAVRELRAIEEGDFVLVDGTTGTIKVGVAAAVAKALVDADNERREAIRAWRGPAQTRDGVEVELLANVQDGATAQEAAAGEARGVGLFRTELCLLSAKTEPSVEEQARIYGEVFDAFDGAKVIVRTLDAGSDKPVPFASCGEEENPALGVRGIRLGWTNPGLIDRQLDAITLAARRAGVAKALVMAPMVATVDEAAKFASACRQRGLSPGIMVEVPAVALLADEFLREVDFFSIGTNDLTQYAVAADRLSSTLAGLTTPWQPAMLRLVAQTAAAGERAGKPVGVCGEAAADPLLACVLLGLGVTSLSMVAKAIPGVGVQLARVTLDQCREAAAQVIAAATAAEAKNLALRLLG